ncbi:MAG: EF-hand domain-containing protein [Phycisphaerales bacterium]
MNMKHAPMVMALSVMTLTAMAGAQTPLPLTNPGFEQANPFNPPEPLGWHNVSNPNGARHRFNNDGLMPAVTARSGVGCIELAPVRTSGGVGVPNSGGFIGFTTDTVNFFDFNFPFYDPVWDYDHPGDVRVTGWYMIPESDPLVNDSSSIKLNIKVGNQDVATLENFDATGANPLAITGHTNGEWRFYSVTFPRAAILAQYEGNIAPNGCACVPANPRPNHCKISPARFAPDGAMTGGRIYWDDMTYEQVLPSEPGCRTDFNNDGFVEPGDLDEFITAFFSDIEEERARCDFNGDGFVEPGDLDEFITEFFVPCE